MLYPGFTSSLFSPPSSPICAHTHTHIGTGSDINTQLLLGMGCFNQLLTRDQVTNQKIKAEGRDTFLFWKTRNPSKQNSPGGESTYTDFKSLFGRSHYKCEVPLEHNVSAVVTQGKHGLCLN